ncbi:MAG: MFS transporter, partial [Deltaproteobacteria bacterium]
MDDAHARLRLAAFYFFAFGGLGGLLPFLPLVFETRGFDSYAISTVMLLLPLSNMFVPPLWGLLADAFNARVAAIRATGIGCAVGTLLLLPDLGLPFAVLGMATYCFFRAPIIPLADSATYAALGARSDNYAR